ncbi:MAG: signal peptidase I [Candidatus Alcyoniella australis]|nr:signal peptidase I [Candidatus Alcyoniella australis]
MSVEQPQAGEAAQSTHRPRIHIHRPAWAGVMSVMQIGWGQFYNGQLFKAAWVFLIAQALSVLAALLAARSGQPLYLPALMLPMYAFAVVESVITARAMGPLHERWVPRWYWHLLFVVLTTLLDTAGYVVVNENVLKYSKIPSTSMLPTLTVMDVIAVDRTAYQDRSPQRGEIVVFRPPDGSDEEWVKRVIGVGGDVVSLDPDEGFLRVNYEPQLETPLGVWDAGLCGDVEQIYLRFRVSAPWGEYEILRSTDMLPEPEFNVRVPQGQLFMMGDCRDYSQDSRIVGPVPVGNVVGRAVFIYTSFDMCRSLPLPVPRPGRTLRRL